MRYGAQYAMVYHNKIVALHRTRTAFPVYAITACLSVHAALSPAWIITLLLIALTCSYMMDEHETCHRLTV